MIRSLENKISTIKVMLDQIQGLKNCGITFRHSKDNLKTLVF